MLHLSARKRPPCSRLICVRPAIDVDVGERRERHARRVADGDLEAARRVDASPSAGDRQLDAHADLALALPHARSRRVPPKRALERVLDVAHLQPVARGRVAIDVGDDVLRAARRGRSRRRARRASTSRMRFDLLELLVHEVEILAVDLDDDLPADAGDRLLDAVLDGLAEVVDDARAASRARRAWRRRSAPSLRPGVPLALGLHDDERLGLVRRLVVGAVLGVALLGEDVLHLGELEQREARLAQHLGAALERDGARHRHRDVDVALVHLGQELGAELAGSATTAQPRARDARRAAAISG